MHVEESALRRSDDQSYDSVPLSAESVEIRIHDMQVQAIRNRRRYWVHAWIFSAAFLVGLVVAFLMDEMLTESLITEGLVPCTVEDFAVTCFVGAVAAAVVLPIFVEAMARLLSRLGPRAGMVLAYLQLSSPLATIGFAAMGAGFAALVGTAFWSCGGIINTETFP